MVHPGEDLQVRFDYNAFAYEEGVIHGAIGRLERLMGILAADEGMPLRAVGILDEGERSMLLNQYNASVPATGTGKALAEEGVSDAVAYLAPSGPLEEKLVEIWSDVLGVDASVIGVNAEFFRLGGHSLNAVIAINRIGKEFKINLPWKLFLKISTVKEIAAYIQAVAVKTAESREQAGEELREQLVF
jgi:acyl carrier protein